MGWAYSDSSAQPLQDMSKGLVTAQVNFGISPILASAITKFIHYSSPLMLFSYYLGAATYASFNNKPRAHVRKTRIIFLIFLVVGVTLTYIVEAVTMLIRILCGTGLWASEHMNFYVMASTIVWCLLQISLLQEAQPIWYPHWGSWLIGLFSEVALLASMVQSPGNYYESFGRQFRVILIGLFGARISLLLLLVGLLPAFREKLPSPLDSQGEGGALLSGQAAATYGTAADQGLATWERRSQEVREKIAKRKGESGGWWGYMKTYIVLWKHMWPSKNRNLQARVLLVFICLGIERGLNVLVPVQMGKVPEALVSIGIKDPRLWLHVAVFIFYRWLASASGVYALREYLWLTVRQYAHRSLSIAGYNHILDLSCDFHTSQKTGELVVAFGRGRGADGFINLLAFSVLPNIADFVVAFTYFYLIYSTYMALIIGFVSLAYFKVTSWLSRTREQVRRRYNKTLENEYDHLYKSFGGWTTVSYFNRFSYEKSRYAELIRGRQRAQLEYDLHIALISVAQNLIFTVGLLLASFLAVYKVSSGQRKVGDFVTLLTYWAQLSVPLSFFTTLTKKLQDEMVDAERLLEILAQKPAIADKPGATELSVTKGEVSVEKISFSYDKRKPVLENISFSTLGGKTVAVVGETGGGKTTLLKLLFRFYDVDSGSIKIDGQDIRDVTLTSLREAFGVVPQDPSLFSGTIIENLRYARFEATDEEIYEACKAACIHEKILSFPEGYLSRVGEQGVKLSGGEKQRIAIARAFLKRPAIVLLDEATSAVDVLTEQAVQQALTRLTVGRTVFVVAHRLTTVMNADLILVLKDGRICERGSHNELMQLKGVYWSYWEEFMDNDTIDLGAAGVDKLSPSQLLLQNLKHQTASPTGLHIRFAKTVSQGENEIFRPHTVPNKSFVLPSPSTGPKKVDNSFHKATAWKPDAKEFVPSAMKLSIVIPTANSNVQQLLNSPGQIKQTVDTVEKCASGLNTNATRAEAHVNNPVPEIARATAVPPAECKYRRRRRRTRPARNSSPNGPSNISGTQSNAFVKAKGNAAQPLEPGSASVSGSTAESRPTSASADDKATRKSANSMQTTPITPNSPAMAKQGLGEAISNTNRDSVVGNSQYKSFPMRSQKATGTGTENSKTGLEESKVAGNAFGNKQQHT